MVSEESRKPLETPSLVLYYSLESLVGVRFVDGLGSNELRILLTLMTLHDEGCIGDEVVFCSEDMMCAIKNGKNRGKK